VNRLEGRVAVVTGAAGGIGLATCRALADAGCALAMVDLTVGTLNRARESLGNVSGRVSLHAADVSDRERMSALPTEVAEEHGAVHIVVNNAGITVGASFADHTLEDWDRIWGVNFWGVVHGCRLFLPYLLAAEEGHIVNLSSMAGFIGLPHQSSYSASKFAVRGLSEALAAELSGTNVGVTSIHPGAVRTRFMDSARGSDVERVRKLAAGSMRFGRPPEAVARAIVKSIRGRKLRARVGIDSVATDVAKRLLPVGLHRLMGLAFRRMVHD
jgi:NAD(P)-dependent dehydrogenase (short-subunit alcohol dehydrogenase family)